MHIATRISLPVMIMDHVEVRVSYTGAYTGRQPKTKVHFEIKLQTGTWANTYTYAANSGLAFLFFFYLGYILLFFTIEGTQTVYIYKALFSLYSFCCHPPNKFSEIATKVKIGLVRPTSTFGNSWNCRSKRKWPSRQTGELSHYHKWLASSARQSSLKGRENTLVSHTNIGTVSKTTLGKLLKDGVERMWVFLSA